MSDLKNAIAVCLAVPPEALAADPVLAERVKIVVAFAGVADRLSRETDPVRYADLKAEAERLGDRLLQFAGSPAGSEAVN